MLTDGGRDLLTEFFNIRRFEVVQQDTLSAIELLELGRESRGGQVQADVRHVLQPIREGTLGDDRIDRVEGVDGVPDLGCRPGIRSEGHRAVTLNEDQTNSWDHMINRNRDNAEIPAGKAGDGELFPSFELNEADRRTEMVRYAAEIGPGVVVEQMTANVGQYTSRRIDCDGFVVCTKNILNEKGDRGGVIHVRMGEHDVPNPALLLDREGARDSTSVDGDGAVEKERRHATIGTVAAEASQDAESHEISITRGDGRLAQRTGRIVS